MKFSDQLLIIETANFRNRLLYHLPYRVAFSNIRTNATSSAAILGNVLLYHLSIARCFGLREPAAIGNHDRFGYLGPANCFDKLITLVGSSGGNQCLWVVVLLLEPLNESADIW